MTRRERKENKMDRLREWARNREAKASAVFAHNEPYTSDIAFNTQPGHIAARARIIAQEDRAYESLRKADGMESRAAGIESQLANTVFSDDDNAIEAIQERIAKHESQRDRMKACNRIYQSKPKNQLTEEKVAALMALGLTDANAREGFKPDFCGRIGFPAYALTNLGARIRTDKERIETLKVRQARTAEAEAAPNGVTLEPCQGGYVRVTFAEKPDRTILDALRSAGFYWGSGSWAGKAESLPTEVKTLVESVTA